MTESDRQPDRCSAPFRVRFDEAAPDGRIRTSVLLRYAQDLAWFHSAYRGFTREWYRDRGLTWLARAAEVTVEADIGVGDELVGTTQVVGWRRVWARRRTDFVDASANLVAWTHVDWVLLDARGAPTRVPGDFDEHFWAPEARFPLGRVALDDPPADRPDPVSLDVRPQELDPMDHVNNAVYADWVDEVLLTGGGGSDVRAIPRTMRLEYARAVDGGATVTIDAWRDETGWSCRVHDGAGGDFLRARLESAAFSSP
jgi:acyl-ACP thioesterase